MRAAAATPWSVRTHWVWPQSFRTHGVFAILCVAMYDDCDVALPKEVWLDHVLSFCGRDWFPARSNADAAGQKRLLALKNGAD